MELSELPLSCRYAMRDVIYQDCPRLVHGIVGEPCGNCPSSSLPQDGAPTTDEPVFALGHADPVDHLETPAYREKATDAWHRELNDGRVEVMCRAPGFRIRVSAPEDLAWEAVEMFERWTGLAVESGRRPRRISKPLEGQLTIMHELESSGSDG